MVKVALTGGIASGKSTVSNYFADLGICIVDADVAARAVVEPKSTGLAQLVDQFGTEILDSNGALNRLKLRQMIFSNDETRAAVNAILHPLIHAHMSQAILAATSAYVLCVIPLLYESKQWNAYDRVLLVTAPMEVRLHRLMTRDHCSQEQAQTILNAQATDEERGRIATDVLRNDGSHDKLKQDVVQLHHQYLKL